MQGELQNGRDKPVFVGFEESTGACEFYLSIDKKIIYEIIKEINDTAADKEGR